MRKTALFLLLIFIFNPGTAFAERIEIKEGTEILLKLLTPLKSGIVKEGQVIEFLAEKAVKNKDGFVLIEDDASAYRTVTVSKKAGFSGTSGKLDFRVDNVAAYNGADIPVRAQQTIEGKDSVGATVAGFLLVSVLCGLFRGDNASVTSGTLFKVYVDKTIVLSDDITPEVKQEGFAGTSDVDIRLNEMLKKIEGNEE